MGKKRSKPIVEKDDKKRKGPIIRTDKLPHGMNRGKEQKVREVLYAWRRCAPKVAAEQWRLFFCTGAFNKRYQVHDKELGVEIGSARVQMLRHQVVGILESFLSNAANEFRVRVSHSSLDERKKHMLYVVNLLHAWYSKIPIHMQDTGERIPDDVRRFARRLMASILSHWKKPDCSHIGMVLDSRVETIEEPRSAETFGLWVNFKTLKMKEKDPKVKGCLNPGYESINIPLMTTDHFLQRQGIRKKGLQVTEDKQTGRLWFGVYTDISWEVAAWRSQYQDQVKTPEVHLDFGLSVMLATNEGDLYGRDWLKHLSYYDRRITRFAAEMRRQGKRPKESRRYREEVAKLKGYIKTEVNRILNRIVEQKRPGMFVVERLDFRNPTLSRRLNRIIQNCGRKAIKAKLEEIEEVLGVPTVEVNPAYTSQECSSCHYVDKRNRRDRDHFHCLWCGLKLHADVNGSRNTGIRRSDGQLGSVYHHRRQVLDVLVRRHVERWGRSCRIGRPGSQEVPIDPRFANPYFSGNPHFKEWAATGRLCDSNDGPVATAPEGSSQNGVTDQLAVVTL